MFEEMQAMVTVWHGILSGKPEAKAAYSDIPQQRIQMKMVTQSKDDTNNQWSLRKGMMDTVNYNFHKWPSPADLFGNVCCLDLLNDSSHDNVLHIRGSYASPLQQTPCIGEESEGEKSTKAEVGGSLDHCHTWRPRSVGHRQSDLCTCTFKINTKSKLSKMGGTNFQRPHPFCAMMAERFRAFASNTHEVADKVQLFFTESIFVTFSNYNT